MEENISYITGNYGKYVSVKEKFEKENILISYFEYNTIEPDVNDIKYVSKEKAKQAYDVLKSPVFVIDTGFYIENYPDNPGYPGAFVKRSGISTDIDSLLKTMENVENRECFFLDCLTYYDGLDFYQFFGESKGILSKEKKGIIKKRAKSNLWYVFIPENYSKTLAEMTDDEIRNLDNNKISATTKFINWYKTNYLASKRLVKKKKGI